VEAYFKSGVTLPPAAMWNRTNKGIPDIASIGHNLIINDADYGGCVGDTALPAPRAWRGAALRCFGGRRLLGCVAVASPELCGVCAPV
jgi:hypothetical protein